MASGNPDYLRQVRQMYGGAHSDKFGYAVTANALNELGTVKGKGIIYGGFITLEYTSTQLTGYPMIEIDGRYMEYASFFLTNKMGFKQEHSLPLYELLYDDVNFRYNVGVMPGITFEEKVTLLYREWEGTTPTVIGCLIYALM